jgi:hypothetical protein
MPLWWIEMNADAGIDLEGLGCTVYTYRSSDLGADTTLVEADQRVAGRIRQLPGVTSVERPRDSTYTDQATGESYLVSGDGTSIEKRPGAHDPEE